MKRMFLMLSLLMVSEQTVFSDWKLGKIYNDSDLKLESAWRHKHKGKPRYIATVTKSLNNAKPSQRITDVTYSVYSKQDPMSILVKNKTDSYDIFFDSHATHSLQWQRAKSQVVTKLSNDKSCSIEDGSHCARVWMKLLTKSVSAERPTAFYGYDEEPNEPMIMLDLTIKGTNGLYTLSLSAQE